MAVLNILTGMKKGGSCKLLLLSIRLYFQSYIHLWTYVDDSLLLENVYLKSLNFKKIFDFQM